MNKEVNNASITNSASQLLLEIGTEEIPARFLPEATVKLKENAEKIFSEYRLSLLSIRTYATPRRLALIAETEPVQQAAEKEIWGPPVNVSFDKDGNPTRAAEAFANTHGLKIEELIKKEKAKGTYLVAIIKESALKTADLLPEILSKLVLSLNFPKSMRWGDSDLKFVRPIHWILALYNNEKVSFALDTVKSNSLTKGHRFLSPASFELKDSSSYISLLRNNYVVLDPEERRKIILDESKKLTSGVNAILSEDTELLDHVKFLVEYPTPVLGTFSADYLSLPKELLKTVMKGHQKYFAVEDEQGNLTNYFIVVSNTKKENAETIKKGAEKVIKARFEDARFYFDEDRKTPLKERLEGLKKVIYHDKLGSLYDKGKRISSIAAFIADKCCPEKTEDIKTAALISKADLISGVVREFPELQGIMGGYYALNDDYNTEISKALAEQYLPAYSGDRLPETDAGIVLSLSDKLDNLASFFMLGLTPTGTEDPFALRRQTLGIISILFEKKNKLSISKLLNRALQSLSIKNRQDLLNDLVRFFEQRLEPLLQSGGYSQDAVSAVMFFAKDNPLYTLKGRLDAIKELKQAADYETFLLAIKRINNIAPKDAVPPVDNKLFAHDEETRLYADIKAVTPKIHASLKRDRYFDAIRLIMTLKDPINNFFDKVLVMDKNEEIKQNRLSLIKDIQSLAMEIADFSKLN